MLDLASFPTSSAEDKAWYFNYMVWVLWSIPFAAVAVCMVIFVSSYSAGSGIPEMKSILSGIVAPPYLSIDTLVAKEVGLLCALAAGLSIGKVGPYVHICAIFCAQLLEMPLFGKLQANPSLKIQLLAAACAAGVSSSFGTPIGGVLFSMEVTTTYYLVENFWQTAALACWTLLLINMWGGLGILRLFTKVTRYALCFPLRVLITAVAGAYCFFLQSL